MRRSPGFALSAIATLGLALGASIAVLTVAYGVLLRPLIVQDSERVLVASLTDAHFPDRLSVVSFPRYREWRESGTAFEHLSAIARTHFDLTGDGPAERVVAQVVSDNFFDMLGVPALIGRTFDDSDSASAPCVRAALGSEPGALVALMLRHAAVLLVPAALAGLVLAAFSTRALASQLFEVSPLDGLSFALSALGLLSVGFAAAYIPARQAAHIDPMAVLRNT